MQFFENIRRRRHRATAARHRQWWETAAEFPVEFPPDDNSYDPDESINFDTLHVSEDSVSMFDPMGSYTGNPIDGGPPVQDADDL
ncbi:MAG: hypothetical protein FWE40_07515 [Oscillospiraceae bacterium]|nr:hypothetical protein [Oscillospiraceae bacterium]